MLREGVQGRGCGVRCEGFMVQVGRLQGKGAGFRVLSAGFRVPGAGFRAHGFECRVYRLRVYSGCTQPYTGPASLIHGDHIPFGGNTYSTTLSHIVYHTSTYALPHYAT